MFRIGWQASGGLASFCLAVSLGLPGCGDSTAPQVDYDAIENIVFSEHVQPLLTSHCATAECHDATDPAAGFSVASYEDLAAGSRHGAMIVPFEPEWSHLYRHVTGDIEPRMPLERSPLSDAQIRFLRRWIAEGATDGSERAMYSDVASKVFVACQGENAVAVVDMDTGRLVRLIRVEAPHSVYVDRTTDRLLVSRFENASDNIHVYDPDTYELLATGKSGTFPALMEITPDGSQLWVTNFDESTGDNQVRVLNPATLEPIATLSFGLDAVLPHGLAILSDGSRAFITNIQSGTVTFAVTNPPGGTGSGVVPLPPAAGTGHQPQQCVLSKQETRLFVGALGSDRVFVLDVLTEETTASVAVGDGPWHLALSPDGTELWVANWLGESVSVVDVRNPDAPIVVDTLKPGHPYDSLRPVLVRPIGISFGPDGRVYVSCANDNDQGSGHHPPPEGEKNPGNLVVFDASTRQVLSVTELPNFARFASFRPR